MVLSGRVLPIWPPLRPMDAICSEMLDGTLRQARVERTLFEIGSRKIPHGQILAELEPWKHLEGQQFTDDECYRKLVHIAFYSGFRAQTVSDKIPVIDRHFPNYTVVSKVETKKDPASAEELLAKQVNTYDEAELCKLLLEISLLDSAYQRSTASRDDVLMDAAKRYRVDTEKLQKAVAKEFVEKRDKKTSKPKVRKRVA